MCIITLKKNYEFRRILSKGKYMSGKLMSMYILPNSLNVKKVGFAIGKKAGKSVERNRIKRLLREGYRLQANSIIDGYSIIIVWRNKKIAKECTFGEIYREIEYLTNKLNLRDENYGNS